MNSLQTPRQNIELEPEILYLKARFLSLVSSYDISSVPDKTKIPNMERKVCTATIITSSHYKNDLIDKSNRKNEMGNKGKE